MHQRLAVLEALRPLIGLKLAIARNAASMKNFQFGEIKPHPHGKGTVGQFALHVQCAWRITGPLGIVTGSADRYKGPLPDVPVDEEDWAGGNFQANQLSELLGGFDHATRSIVNVRSHLFVDAVDADSYGGIYLNLSGGYSLHVFPDASQQEAWRLFAPGDTTSHFVFPTEQPDPDRS